MVPAALLSAWIPFALFAAVIVIGIPAWCWWAGDDEPPANAITHEQERPAPERTEMRLPSRRDTLTPAA